MTVVAIAGSGIESSDLLILPSHLLLNQMAKLRKMICRALTTV